MEKLYNVPEECCGCSACADVCPKNAIQMKSQDGFLYPEIDQTKCVECGLCRKVCAFKEEKKWGSNCLKAYALRANDSNITMASSSGGVFTLLSDYVLEQGGVVYGAAYDGAMRVCHQRAETAEQRNAMRGSKYVQSDATGIYRRVRDDLKDGRKVLFTGAPCQVAALRAFLGREFDNLICVDIICHGVPNPKVWEQYVSYMEKKYGKKLKDYSFRNKNISWKKYSAKLTFDDGSQIAHNDFTGSYIELFRYDVCMRPSCTRCRYASTNREGDITIGDFWGIEKVLPEVDTAQGVSAVMVRSEKGAEILCAVKDRAQLWECQEDQIAAGQRNMREPSGFSNKAEAFQADWKSLNFETVLKKYTRVGVKRRVIDGIKKILHKG